MSSRIVQQTLEGLSVSTMPRVRTTDGHLLDWDKDAIAKQLLKETKLSEQFYKVPSITEDEAKDIAREVERRIRWMNVKYLSGPLVREIMNVVLLERRHAEWRNICTRVGTPVYDAHLIDIGTGFEARENANLQENAETSHKKKADKISKEQYLLLLPSYLADRHLAGDLHIHDLEYFGTRPFCLDGSTEVLASIDIDASLGSTNGTTTITKVKIPLQIKLRDIQFKKEDTIFAPHGLSVLTPRGYRRIIKATRREVHEGELLHIQTTSGKSILATGEHRIPVKTPSGMEILPARVLSVGDVLYNLADFDFESAAIKSEFSGNESICLIEIAKPSGRYVYDLFVEGDGTEESHTFFTSDGLLVHNCQDWDLRYFFYYGLMPDGLGTKASVAGPAKKPEVAILHAVKALGSAQTNFAGGQGFYNFLTFIAPYFEGLEYEEIKQLMQMFVYEMTQMMVARGGQLVFSSVQLTPGVPTLWKDKPAVYSGKVWDGVQTERRTYGQFEREVRLAFKALMEVMLTGDHWGKPFNFPKPEISIEPDFMHEDEEFNRAHPDLPTYQDLYLLTFKLAAEYGTPYFDNQLPDYRGAGKGISCYQCLAEDELVPFAGADGVMSVKQIGALFRDVSKNGMSIDPDGIEFAKFSGSTPSIDFKTFKASLKSFSGVMRKGYKGELLNITLNSGRRIRVTPDHPVFVLDNCQFKKKRAKELEIGEYMPVLKNLGLGVPSIFSLDIDKTLASAGYGKEISISAGEVNIKNAKKHELPKDLLVTPEMARFLGYYLAEGCSDHSGRRYSVRLSFGKHETDLIDDATRCISSLGFEPLISVEKTATNVCVNSKLLYLLIDALGCGHHAHDKSVPDLLFNVGYNCVNQYLIIDNTVEDALRNLINGDIHPLMIKRIEEEDYEGYVYDLVDVSDTHNFSNALGVITGNCCAYQFATTYEKDPSFEQKLYFKDGMHFSMGSWQVVSLNCPRAAYLARGDDDLLFEYLRELMDVSVEIFQVKREWMNQIVKSHRMPFATQTPRDPLTGEKGATAVDLDGLVYTIGVVGVNEMAEFHTGKQMHESKDAWKLAVRAMTEMELYAKELSKRHSMTIALARTPAETTAQRFAVSDLIHEEFRECAERVVKGDLEAVKKNLQKTRDLPVYYTNGTHAPPSADISIFERAKLEHVFFPIVDGGNIFHIFMGESTPDPKGLMDFGMRLAKTTQIGYFTFTKDMTVCLCCAKVSPGLKDNCPNCESPDVDHISRITGYLQAVSGWNNAKKQELKDRKRYNDLI